MPQNVRNMLPRCEKKAVRTAQVFSPALNICVTTVATVYVGATSVYVSVCWYHLFSHVMATTTLIVLLSGRFPMS